MHRLEKVFALKMETAIESVLGKGTLAQEQVTYVKYFLLLIVTLITIQLSRIIMSKIFSASQVAGKNSNNPSAGKTKATDDAVTAPARDLFHQLPQHLRLRILVHSFTERNK